MYTWKAASVMPASSGPQRHRPGPLQPAGTRQSSFQYDLPKGLLGFVGRITYNFDNRYLAEFNAGYNGSENFAEGKRFGFFPAFSLGWILTEEKFIPRNKFLTYAKIRGSYGEVGTTKSAATAISTCLRHSYTVRTATTSEHSGRIRSTIPPPPREASATPT